MNSLNSNYLHMYDEDGLTLDKLREFVEATKDKDGNIKVYINSNNEKESLPKDIIFAGYKNRIVIYNFI